MDSTPEDLRAYIGKPAIELPTPSVIYRKHVIERNCKVMLEAVRKLSIGFRAHVKTHKTVEVTRMMLNDGEFNNVVVSTLREARGLAPLVEEGVVKDILYGLPLVPSQLPHLSALSQKVQIRLMVDHAAHLDILSAFPTSPPWSIFIKVDMGSHRAGMEPDSPRLKSLVEKALASPAVSLHGFYCHAGHSYSSKSKQEAAGFLHDEIAAAVQAAELVDEGTPLVLSVGATPTAHVVASLEKTLPATRKLEVHGGNYPINDLQQLATGCIEEDDEAMRVLAEVCSLYPDRNEAIVNAGVVALAREPGQLPGFARVNADWAVGRLSQEHGIVVPTSEGSGKVEECFTIGQKVLLEVQHACITSAAHGWYFVVDEDDIVRDVWFPWKGW